MKKISITLCFQITAGVYILIFLFEDFPLLIVATGLATCVAYFFVLKTFPFFDLSSPPFIASVGKRGFPYL